MNLIELEKLKAVIGSRKFWLAASTHKGEEEIVVQAHKSLKKEFPDLLTILVPRHPNRGEEIKSAFAEINFAQRSKNQDIAAATEIYLADSSSDRTNSLTDTWNPGDKKSGNIFFSLPSESEISSIFFGPPGTSSIEGAVLIAPVSVTAIDPQTKKRKDCESTFKGMNEMLSRWREASEYPWVVGSPSCFEMENVYFLATISAATGVKYPEGGELPQCFGNVVAKTQIENLYVLAKKNDYALFEDTVSGFGIVTLKGGLDSEFCSYELGKIPTLRVLN